MATRNPSLGLRPSLSSASLLKSATSKGAFALDSMASNDSCTAHLPAHGSLAEEELHGERGMWWYTGVAPRDCPGFDADAGVLRALPLPNTSAFTRQSVLDYFDNTWTLTEVLFGALQGADSFTRQPYHQLRHPKIFYYGHPAVLYINKFRVAGLLADGIDPVVEQMFETGVDEMSWDDLSAGRDDWHSVRAIHEYRRCAYNMIRKVIKEHPCLEESEVGWDSQAWAIFMGFEHERIHLETSSVLIRELPLNCVRKPDFWPDYHPSAQLPSAAIPKQGVDFPVNNLIQVDSELVVLGKALDYPSFGFDNEYGAKQVEVPSFKAAQFKTTNGEFLRFVRAGGYTNPKYWSVEGWGWKTFRNVKWPTFWLLDGPQGLHRYKLRVTFDAIDMRWDWPVDVNYHEATAFCAWRTEQDGSVVRYRIVTEAEHMLLRNAPDRVDAHRFSKNSASAGATAAAPAAAGAASLPLPLQDGPASPATTCGGSPAAAAGGDGGSPTAPFVVFAHGGDTSMLAVGSSGEAPPSPTSSASACCGGGDVALRAVGATASRRAGGAAANEFLNPDVVMTASGMDAAARHGYNFQLAYGSSSPVTALPPSEKGFHDAMGSAWEWGEDHFAAFPGFKVHPYYEDFSLPCFGGKHNMILGGSWVSTGQLASKFARYQFRPHFFQHASFRLITPVVDTAKYDMTCYGPSNPLLPFFETSCMDGPPPHAGNGPCCSRKRRAEFTPTADEARASTKAKTEAAQVLYESDRLLTQYLSMHYGPAEQVYPPAFTATHVSPPATPATTQSVAAPSLLLDAIQFPRKAAEKLSAAAAAAATAGTQSAPAPGSGCGRALDLGCAVGGSTFELARSFGEVVGVDISKTFVEVATKMRDNGHFDYEVAVEGTITQRLTARIDESINASRTRFVHGDACAADLLALGNGAFDAVLAANLIDRVPQPRECLRQIHAALRPGGVALITSSFAWSDEFTDRANWIGGIVHDGVPLRSADELRKLLVPDFHILQEDTMPLILHEEASKFQLLTTHCFTLQRK